MGNYDDNSFEECFDDDSFTFSEPDDQPESIRIEIGEGSLLNYHDFTGALQLLHQGDWNIISDTLKLVYWVIGESKLDHFIPISIICMTNFHEPVRRDLELAMVVVCSSCSKRPNFQTAM